LKGLHGTGIPTIALELINKIELIEEFFGAMKPNVIQGN
jgi:hypothetical protein